MVRISFTDIWIIELIVLAIVIGLLIETVVTNSKKIQVTTEELYTSSEKVQFLLGKIDHEFEVINNCAKIIKIVFLNVGKSYKEIAAGSTTIEEAVEEAKNNIPFDLRTHMSSLFNIPLEEKDGSSGPRRTSSIYESKHSKTSAPYNNLPTFHDVSSSEMTLGDDFENIINSLGEEPREGSPLQVFKMHSEVQA